MKYTHCVVFYQRARSYLLTYHVTLRPLPRSLLARPASLAAPPAPRRAALRRRLIKHEPRALVARCLTEVSGHLLERPSLKHGKGMRVREGG